LWNKNTKDTRDHSRVFFYFKWFCPLNWFGDSGPVYWSLLSPAIGTNAATDKMEIIKGLGWRFFGRTSRKNTTRPLIIFKRVSSAPLLRWQEVGFLGFPFFRKKGEGLKVLVGTADSLAEHTLYEYKV